MGSSHEPANKNPVVGNGRQRLPRKPVSEATRGSSDDGPIADVRRLLNLQRQIGNYAVNRLLRTVVQRKTAEQEAADLAAELKTLIDGATWKEIRKRVYPKESAAGVKRAKERKDKKRPDLTGLGQIKTLEHFAAAVKGLQAKWSSLKPGERVDALRDAINAELVSVDVPPFIKVIPEKMEFKGNFSRFFWEFRISEDMVNNSTLSTDDAAELANTTLHEARHAEQAFLMARYTATVNKKDADGIVAEVKMPKSIAEKAKPFDAKTDAAVVDLGKRMYQAGVTDRLKNQTISNDDGLPELEDRRNEAIAARSAVQAAATSDTLSKAKAARDALRAQIQDVEKRYTDYRNIPYEADAHEVGDAEEQAFKGWP